jgi:UTP--glucose-1-phosphate uridylyltransferase
MKVRKAVIPVAGFGTRLLPATKSIPKEMLNIVDKPAIQYVIEEAVESGIEDILIVTTRNKAVIENHFDRTPELDSLLEKNDQKTLLELSESLCKLANIHFIRQHTVSGLGHAILKAKSFIGSEPFAVLLADDLIHHTKPCLRQLLDVYKESQVTILGVQKVSESNVQDYGIVDGQLVTENQYEVKDLVEKPLPSEAPSNLAIVGRYILSPTIFDILEDTEAGLNDEVQLTDALIKLSCKEPMLAYEFKGNRYDVGNKMGYLKACVEYGLRHEELGTRFKKYIMDIMKR